MEQLLYRLVRQLDAMDEASLMSLWDKYAAIVKSFEPTRRWEEAALILTLIQGKRWKNQLFNQQWAAQTRPNNEGMPQTGFSVAALDALSKAQDMPVKTAQKRGKVLRFRPVKSDETA